MPVRIEAEYNQISQDWRHRDNLTWQIPSIIVAIGGGLTAAAFGLNIAPQYICIVRPILLGFGALLAGCLTFALAQNLWYQVGSGEALIRIASCKGSTIPNDKLRRTLNRKDFHISRWDFVKRLSVRLAGSAVLLVLCMIITSVLVALFVWSIIA